MERAELGDLCGKAMVLPMNTGAEAVDVKRAKDSLGFEVKAGGFSD